MFERIKILCIMQISSKFKFKKITNKRQLIASLFKLFLKFCIATAVIGGLLWFLIVILCIPATVNLFTFFICLFQVMSIISCTMGLLSNLYTSKDNMLLLSYPVKPIEVFLSKLLVYYALELIKGAMTMLPFMLAFGIIGNCITPLYIISMIIALIILPLIPVLAGAIITIPIIFIRKLIFGNVIVKAIAALGFLVGLFFLVVYVMSFLPVPLRILALYNSFVTGLTNIVAGVSTYSGIFFYIGQIFFNTDVLISILLSLAFLVALVLLVAFISMPLYFKMASKVSEHANLKKHIGINKAHSNTFWTFFRKEWLLSIRDPGNFISNYSFTIAIPYVLYIMMTIFASVDRNDLGNLFLITFSGMIVLAMASGSNTASAMAITSEGSEFALLKIAPGKTSNMAYAKILFNLVFSTIMIIASYVLIILVCNRLDNGHTIAEMFELGKQWYEIDKIKLLLMMIAVIFMNIGLIFWSFQIDMLNPALSEYASTGGGSGHLKNYSRSLLSGFIWSVLFAILSVVFLLDNANLIWSWGRIMALAAVFLGCRFFLFRSNLKAYFKEIEF